MDPKTKERFNELIKKNPTQLLPGEVAFLRARRAYIGPRSQKRLASILTVKAKKR